MYMYITLSILLFKGYEVFKDIDDDKCYLIRQLEPMQPATRYREVFL